MPILQVVKEGLCIDFRHVLQITNKTVLSVGSLILTITIYTQQLRLCHVMKGIVP